MSMKPVLSIAVLGVAVACGSKEVTTGIQDPPASCIAIGPTVVPASATIIQGDSIRLTVSQTGCSSQGKSFLWSSSNSAIASIVRETGVVHALSLGTVTITAKAAADTTVRGAAVITVGGIGTDLNLVIKSVSYVSNGKPANLDSLADVIQVDATAGSVSGGSQTAELVIVRSGGDTVVATSTSPAPVPQNYTHSLRWNTDARNATGARVFANGTTLFRVRFTEASGQVVNSTSQQATLKNP